MISRLSGKILDMKQGSIVIESGSISYEVLIPMAVMKEIERETACSGDIQLVTYHYLQVAQSSAVPVLIGFRNDVEKEFFERFISVSGIGPKAACKALAENFSKIAAAIDDGNEALLKGLPGIGGRKAAEIIAKLKGKVGKYCLIRERETASTPVGGDELCREDIAREAIDVLKQLQYGTREAEQMVEKAFLREPGIKTSEELLNEVYRQRKPL